MKYRELSRHREEIIALHKDGYSAHKLALKYDCPWQYIQKMLMPEDERRRVLSEYRRARQDRNKERLSGQRIIAVERKIRGWTQADLARRVGVKAGTVLSWEKGYTRANEIALKKAFGKKFRLED